MSGKLGLDNDGWYESEELTRAVMIEEMQRIRRRTRVRPLPVIALAFVLTSLITYKVATKARIHYAEVVLAMREGSLGPANKVTGLPLMDLAELVSRVLIPDAELAALIEKRDLHRLRRTLGMPWAIGEMRDAIHVESWRNSFIYYDPELPNREASARVGITVADDDPDRAFLLAKDVAAIVIAQVRERRIKLARQVAGDVAAWRDAMHSRMVELERERTERMVAHARALSADKQSLAHAIHLRLMEIDSQQRAVEKTLTEIAHSQEALADRIAEAGLDLVVEVVGERRPPRPENQGLVLVMTLAVVGVGVFLVVALVLGAFDSRVHDSDDVARLGLPVLGHVPPFAGDRSGSLEARGVHRSRIPLVQRWRSHR
jgi:hypothetical protein